VVVLRPLISGDCLAQIQAPPVAEPVFLQNRFAGFHFNSRAARFFAKIPI
jgi:hypothetical protein